MWNGGNGELQNSQSVVKRIILRIRKVLEVISETANKKRHKTT